METARWGDVRLDAIVAEFGDLIGRRVILIMYLEIIFNIYIYIVIIEDNTTTDILYIVLYCKDLMCVLSGLHLICFLNCLCI